LIIERGVADRDFRKESLIVRDFHVARSFLLLRDVSKRMRSKFKQSYALPTGMRSAKHMQGRIYEVREIFASA
jgi:hypothetical protein